MVAERQTNGRGRRGRAWNTAGGALACSVLLPAYPAEHLSLLPLAAGVAVQRAAGVGGLKWPNDLLAPDGRKLGGILLEVDLRGAVARRAVLGVGLNVRSAPPGAAALNEFCPGLTRAEVLGRLLGELEELLTPPLSPPQLLDAWREVNVTLGQQVRLFQGSQERLGTAQSIDASGALWVRGEDGEAFRVTAGDVALVGTLPQQK
ncbi:biotin--[acetyl-CoA-carboxylase] ligase [Deinococcus lacus]|uniref:biotin--[biotin carboxyl-carrier protein] ligase n=1 Tax=Deinococcus lacus TaxID=392561 RepID=A0ABW1YAY8_9DEIO